MPLLAVAIPFLAPLLLAPHLLFYYDITPKIVLLLVGAAIAPALALRHLDSLHGFCGTRSGRWFTLALGASLAITVLATLLATHQDLAWQGSNWRRLGALTELAILPLALLIAAYTSRAPQRLLPLLRALCAAGLLSSLYGIAQYFGWDPLLPAAQYHVGEGIYEIVRPPGPLGHADYFAAFLLWPVFAALALSVSGVLSKIERVFGALTAFAGIVAILLSGSRGAALALAAGVVVLVALQRPRPRTLAALAAGAAVACGVFYLSPSGARMRARVHWISEDPVGGSRLLLWRDSLRMAASKPFTGFGPENFVADFPSFQSAELERAYPDFSNESPHNVLLDALVSEGAPGLLVLLALIGIAVVTALREHGKKPILVGAVLPAFTAALLAHQFVVFSAVNEFFFYLGAALLAAAAASPDPAPTCVAKGARYGVVVVACASAILFSFAAYRLISTDAGLASVQRLLDENQPEAAAEAYRSALSRPSAGLSADLYFSRRFAAAAISSPVFATKLYYSQIAAGAATLATHLPEDRSNAWYNLSILAAGRRDPTGVELCLRNAIAAAPVWYKPHWTLARLLASQGRTQEAEPEARQALDLNGAKDPEVVSTLEPILRSAARSR